MKKLATILGALAVTAAMPAFAHDHGDMNAKKEAMARYYFYKMDADHNGYVSRPENETFASGMFTRADANMDGFLTYSELLAFKTDEWNDYKANFYNRGGAAYDGDKYYPYGKGAPTVTPNEPFKANRGKTDRSWREYEIRDHNEDE